MAYQNVSTPRFYINIPEWLESIGITSLYQDFLRTLPISPQLASPDIFPDGLLTLPPLQGMTDNGFIAILGHNYGDLSDEYNYFRIREEEDILTQQEIVNCSSGDSGVIPMSGFSIAKFLGNNNITDIFIRYAEPPLYIGSIVFGTYYDMPVAPDLSLSLEHDYSGIKKTTSMSGASFSNANWIKPPKWVDKEAWQLGDFPRPYSGRRIWDLSFSYISDSDLEPRNYTGTLEDTQHQQGDDNWFENVLHYTMGGHLPFIFQPDKDAVYEPQDAYIGKIPEFAICRFDMNSFSREQVAPGVYNIKIKVKESW
jgi:hypothetical protein